MHTKKKNIVFYIDKYGMALGFLKSHTIYYIDITQFWLKPQTKYDYHHSGATVTGWLIFYKAYFFKKPLATIIPFPKKEEKTHHG